MAKGPKAATSTRAKARRALRVQPSKHKPQSWANSGATISLGSHIDHVFHLIEAALDTKYEHGWYQLYDWALNFNALRRGKDGYRLSVYPQAKLVLDPSKKTVVKHGDIDDSDSSDTSSSSDSSDSSEEDDHDEAGLSEDSSSDHETIEAGSNDHSSGYNDAESCADVEAILDGAMLDGRHWQQSANATSELENREQTLSQKSNRVQGRGIPQASIRPPSPPSGISSVPSEKEKKIIRYPDFSVTVTLPNKPMGVHSIWEVKVFPEEAFSDLQDEHARFRLLNNIFTEMHSQILQQAICAFNQFPFQNTLHVFCVVGYFMKHLTLDRAAMPEEDYNFKDAKKEDLEKLLLRFRGLRIFHLLSDDRSDYSTQFKTNWTHALSCAINEIHGCSPSREGPTTQADIKLQVYNVPLAPLAKQKTNKKGKGRAVPNNAKRTVITSTDSDDSNSDGEADYSNWGEEADYSDFDGGAEK